MGHENKCAHLHGHNYRAMLTAAGEKDSIGRVIDFSVLKARIGSWIDANWDHGFILHREDSSALRAIGSFIPENAASQKLFLLDDNPTAENLACFLLAIGTGLLVGTPARLIQVTIWETPNCYATAIA